MKQMKTEEAIGQVLFHDITQIIPDIRKDAVFKKGHIVTKEDIPVLLSIGKEHIYIEEKDDTKYHENEAAEILHNLCKNKYMERSEVKEGKIELYASIDGLLKVNIKLLTKINSLGEIMIAARNSNIPVKKGEKICGTRIIPLVIEKEKMERAKEVCGGTSIFTILPYQNKKVGIVTTGNEIYKGRIKDAFGPVIIEKVREYHCEILGQIITDDDNERIQKAVKAFIKEGADMILCTGGMSVDPDDLTPLAIKNTGANVISYGAPVLPGAMFLLSYYQDTIPIIGLPGCVMYAKRTIFDLVLPRLMADDRITAEELSKLGNGGLCLSCDNCHFPNCGFGKGW